MTPHAQLRAAAIATAALLVPHHALADAPPADPLPTEPATDPAATMIPTTPIPAPAPPPERPGQFSGTRFLVEWLASAAIGSAAAYGAFRVAGGDVGGAIAGLVANVAITPLVVYGVGGAMHGEGTVSSAYYGELIGLTAPTTAATGGNAILTLAIGLAFMPITSALVYEFSSNVHSAAHVAITPVVDHGAVTGASAGLAFRF